MKPTGCVGKMETIRMPEDCKDTKNEGGRCCCITMVTVSIVFLLITSGVAAFCVYNLNREHNIKEYQLTVHYGNGLRSTERVVVTDKEEVFETDDVYLIYDFSTGLKVMSYKNEQDFQDCYAISFNTTEIPTPEQLRNKYKDTKIDITAGDQVLEESFEVTDIWLNTEVLGPRSKEICRGKNVYFLKETSVSDSVTRFRRQKSQKKQVKSEVKLFWGLVTIKTTVTKEKKN